jgi:hypothetical protein
MARKLRDRPRFALRSASLGRRLDTFLVCAIAAVLGNRVFLIITGYPQLGNGTLHISHAIWGALMMAIAIVCAVSFLPPFTRSFVAFLGGAGFGWFIDELGKFITRDVNYFFEPTIALIYMTFIAMYLGFRVIERRAFGPEEAVLNGLEALKSAAIGELDAPSRRAAIELLDTTGADGPLAEQVRRLLDDEEEMLPPPTPGPAARAGRRLRDAYVRFTHWSGFVGAVNTMFVVIAVSSIVSVVALALDRRGIRSFSEWATVVSGAVAGILVVVGVPLLRRHRLRAYRWFERGLLVEIFVTQVFVFAEEQLAGVLGLVVILAVWSLLRSAMRAEAEQRWAAATPS